MVRGGKVAKGSFVGEHVAVIRRENRGNWREISRHLSQHSSVQKQVFHLQ